MEVRRKAMSIVLSMTSSRNVEEVALFLKKQLQKTQEADYDKARFYQPSIDLLLTDVHPGLRIQAAVDPVYSHNRDQILRSRSQRRTRVDGVPRGLQQPIGPRRRRIRSVRFAFITNVAHNPSIH